MGAQLSVPGQEGPLLSCRQVSALGHELTPYMLDQLHRCPHHVCISGGVHLAFIPEVSSSPFDTVDHETAVIGRFFVVSGSLPFRIERWEKRYLNASWLVGLLPSLDVETFLSASS